MRPSSPQFIQRLKMVQQRQKVYVGDWFMVTSKNKKVLLLINYIYIANGNVIKQIET